MNVLEEKYAVFLLFIFFLSNTNMHCRKAPKKDNLLHCEVGGCCNIRPLATRSNNVDFPALSRPIISSLAFDFHPRK